MVANSDIPLSERAAHLRTAIVRTARRLRQEAAAETAGLTPTSVAALATIERHGPMTPSEIAGGERLRRLRRRKNAYLARRMRELSDEEVETLEQAAEILERMREGERP